MANGSEQLLQELETPISLSLKGYSESIYFAVGLLKRFDTILGKQWTASNDSRINCRTNEVQFVHRGKRHSIVTDEP